MSDELLKQYFFLKAETKTKTEQEKRLRKLILNKVFNYTEEELRTGTHVVNVGCEGWKLKATFKKSTTLNYENEDELKYIYQALSTLLDDITIESLLTTTFEFDIEAYNYLNPAEQAIADKCLKRTYSLNNRAYENLNDECKYIMGQIVEEKSQLPTLEFIEPKKKKGRK